jgi:hypothetical protein
MVIGDGRGLVAVGDGRGGNLGGMSDSRLLGRGERGSIVCTPENTAFPEKAELFFSLVSPPQTAPVICFFFFRYVS